MARKRKRNRNVSGTTQARDTILTQHGEKTVSELQSFYNNNYDRLKNFEAAQTSFKQITDVTKNTRKAIPTFDKSKLLSYLKNISNNEKNLRNLSWYLYYRSQMYKKLIQYNATMFELDARRIIPNYDVTANTQNDQKMLKEYAETAKFIDNLNLQQKFLMIYLICFLQDVFYGCAYYDDDNGLFILPLDPDYCKIAGRFPSGDFAFAMDMSYFTGTYNYLLEYWGDPFESMYRQYESGGDDFKWQVFPEEYTVCLKLNVEDWRVIVPYYSGLFAELINLEDVKDFQAIADEQDIYKLIWLEMETITGSKNIDDWKVDPEIIIQYFNRMCEEALPDYTSAAIVPGKLNTIGFSDNDATTNSNKVTKATENVLNSGMGGQVLNSISITGTTGLKLAMKVDTELAISSLLGQTQGWVNRYATYNLSTPCKVVFFPISAYTKEDFRKELLENGTYGLPVKLALNTLSGISEYESLATNYLEENILGLSEKFNSPLVSSHTSSGNSDGEVGRPESDDGSLTEDGEQTREKRDRSNE